jgi:hypothetical protein
MYYFALLLTRESDRARTKVAPTRDLPLTPSEQRAAELATSGMARIYRRLGINSRAKLGRLIGE